MIQWGWGLLPQPDQQGVELGNGLGIEVAQACSHQFSDPCLLKAILLGLTEGQKLHAESPLALRAHQ